MRECLFGFLDEFGDDLCRGLTGTRLAELCTNAEQLTKAVAAIQM